MHELLLMYKDLMTHEMQLRVCPRSLMQQINMYKSHQAQLSPAGRRIRCPVLLSYDKHDYLVFYKLQLVLGVC